MDPISESLEKQCGDHPDDPTGVVIVYIVIVIVVVLVVVVDVAVLMVVIIVVVFIIIVVVLVVSCYCFFGIRYYIAVSSPSLSPSLLFFCIYSTAVIIINLITQFTVFFH